MIETWKPVVGMEASYEVSNLGRVRSLNFYGHAGVRRCLKGSLLSGYRRYDLKGSHGRRCVFGHILVLEAFIGPAPAGYEGCHNNGIRDDNALSNLRWDTQSGNQQDRVKHGTDSRGQKSGKAKITEAQARQIRTRRLAGERVGDLASEFGVTGRTVYQIAAGQRWSHLEEIAA